MAARQAPEQVGEVEFEPPRIACIVSGGNYSFGLLNRTGECVIAIPPSRIARKVVQIGNCHGDKIDKFAAVSLTAKPALRVGAPLIAECFVNLECKVIDRKLVRTYNMFILEVVKAWTDPQKKDCKTLHHCGYGQFVLDGRLISLPSKMR